MKSTKRRLQQMFLKYKLSNATPAPPKPPERIQGTIRGCPDSGDEDLSSYAPAELEVLNQDFVAAWIQDQQKQLPCTTAPSGSASDDHRPKLVAYSSSPSSRGSRQSQQSIRPMRYPPQFLMKNSGPQHSKSTTVARPPSASSMESSQNNIPVKHQELSEKNSTGQYCKNSLAAEVTNADPACHGGDDSCERKGKKSTCPDQSNISSLIAPSCEATPKETSGITKSRSKCGKGSNSKSIPAAEFAPSDRISDENPESKEKISSGPLKSISRTPIDHTPKVLSEQNPGRSGRRKDSRSQSAGPAKRSLTFSNDNENINPKKKNIDQKRYGSTSIVVSISDKPKEGEHNSRNHPITSKEVSPIKTPQISPKTNSSQKSLRKKSTVKYTLEDEEEEKEEEENWDYSGSDVDSDKEWKPEGGPEPSSEDDLELSGVESIHSMERASSPLRIQDGGLLGIAPDENEDDDINFDSETPKETAREKKSERKEKRNSGQPYTSTTGKQIAARLRKPVPPCKRRKCHLVISEEDAENIFQEYWEQSSYDKRVNYICNRIESSTVERRRPRNRNGAQPHSKTVSYHYYFDIGGVRHNVCKDAFLCTLGETDRFLRECARKKKTTRSGIPSDDRRGIKKPKHSLKVILRKRILTHINSYPAYESHYCRQQTKQKYLPHTLNLKIMCEQFNAQQAANAVRSGNAEEDSDEVISEGESADNNAASAERAATMKKVSYSTYRRVFSTLNLKFKVPASDTCSTCDTLKMKIKLSKDNEERQKLTEKHEFHLRRAEAAYTLKRQFKTKAKEDSSVGCLIFDLEQVLPTPCVSTGVAYYLRQLNTYNLTIVDASTNITYCYMWHEGEAARGANQIASALYHHLKYEVPDTVEELYLFSDCCSGQNRNSIVSTMFQVLLSVKPSLKRINHIFLIPGHTRMECDTKHSLIERQKKKTATIDVPQDWYSLVRNTSGSFKVIEMAQKFYDFEALTAKDGPLIMREKKDDGSKMYWTKTVWFKYSEPGLVEVKATYNTSAEFDQLSMIRGTSKNRRLKKNWWKTLQKCNPGNKISEEKKKNLMTLLQYVDSKHHAFYRNLVVDASIMQETDPDLPSENDDTDIEDID